MSPYTPAVGGPAAHLPKVPTPARSILRASTTHSRRKSDVLDMDRDPEAPESPTKRRKVVFSDSGPAVHDVGTRSITEVKAEVRKALEQHSKGDHEEYTRIKEYFLNDRVAYVPPRRGQEEEGLKPQELRGYVLALSSCTPHLRQKTYRDLVLAMVRCTWIGRDDKFVQAYVDFLAALVTVQGSYLSEVLETLVRRFGDTQRSQWSVPGFPEVGYATIGERLHRAIRRLLHIFPAAPRVLCGLVKSRFPYADDSIRMYVSYIRNVLRIRDYAPEIGQDVLDVIVEQVVKIDVEMQIDLDDMDDGLTSAVHQALRESRSARGVEAMMDSDMSDTDSVASDESEADEEVAKIKSVTNRVEKLDATMETLFAFHAPAFANPASDMAAAHCSVLMSEFKNIILQTRRSRHTQFLLFHFVQQSEKLMDQFVDTCETIAFRSNVPSVLKDYAVCYLASFLARGAHVPPELIRSVFGRLLGYLERFRRSFEPSCRGPDLKRYYSYYSLAQAAIYIYCFRWKDLIVSLPDFVDFEDPLSFIGHELDWGPDTRRILRTNIYSRLNPLKVCAPGIVEEFAKLAHKLNLMYVYPLLETNKRIRLSQYMSDVYATGGALRASGNESILDENLLQMDPYFPFDPYQLPNSKRWLEGDYLSWTPIRGLNADEDEDDSDEEAMDRDEVDEDTATGSEFDEDD